MSSTVSFATFEFAFPFEKVASTGEWIIEGIASTEEIDREGDVIIKEAMIKAIEKYMKHPVLRYQHDSKRGAIGVVQSAKYTEKGLLVRAKISKTKDNEDIWQKVLDGAVRGLSVAGKIHASKKEFQKGKSFRKITDLEILEISLVDIPANPSSYFEVISKALQSLDKGDEKMEEELKKIHEKIDKLTEAVAKLNEELEVLTPTPLELEKGFEEEETIEVELEDLKQLIRDEIMNTIPLRKGMGVYSDALVSSKEVEERNELEEQEEEKKEVDPIVLSIKKMYGSASSDVDEWK